MKKRHAKPNTLWAKFMRGQTAPGLAHYGVERRHLTNARPTLSGVHDGSHYAVLNTTGLAGAWHFYSERFTPAGRWFFWATIIFGVSGLNSLELQAHVPLIYVLCLWLVAGTARLLARPKFALKAWHAGRVCAGEILPVEIEATSLAGTSLDYTVWPHRLPASIQPIASDGVPLPVLNKSEKARVRLGLQCARRGVYKLKGFRIETDFPFGMLRAGRAYRDESALLVYPAFTPLDHLDIPMGRRYHPGGVALASHLGDSFEFLGNREYREGDNIRDIDWRATARLSRPIVREYREEYFLRAAVVLDTHIPEGSDEKARDNFERAVSLCAGIADFMARQEYIVDILAAGPNLYHLTAGRDIAYLDQILDILACVEENPEEPFATLEPEIGENLDKINTIICIFLDWNESRRAFLERLRRGGAGIKAFVVREGAPTLDPAMDELLFGPIVVVSQPSRPGG